VRITLGDSVTTKKEINSDEFSAKFKFKRGEELLTWKSLGHFIIEEDATKDHPVYSDTITKSS